MIFFSGIITTAVSKKLLDRESLDTSQLSFDVSYISILLSTNVTLVTRHATFFRHFSYNMSFKCSFEKLCLCGLQHSGRRCGPPVALASQIVFRCIPREIVIHLRFSLDFYTLPSDLSYAGNATV